MKRPLITVAFILLMTVSFAQFSMGLKGGLNLSSFNVSHKFGDNGTDYNAHIGYHAGAFISVQFKKIAVQPEVLFSMQGTKMEYSNPNSPSTEDWKSNFTYISVPVLIKFYVVKSRAIGLNIQAGPQFSLLHKAEANYAEYDGDGAQSRGGYVDVKDEYESSDLSVVFGAGLDLPLRLTFEVRYVMGLQNIALTEISNAPETKNQLIQVSLGFRIVKVGR